MTNPMWDAMGCSDGVYARHNHNVQEPVNAKKGIDGARHSVNCKSSKTEMGRIRKPVSIAYSQFGVLKESCYYVLMQELQVHISCVDMSNMVRIP
ncbi:hypothetical protein SUGI_0453370 [Cryptomeria japonica]|nr:hypothetical protein SUGI_0453370 [Cryptomeria japonica]